MIRIAAGICLMLALAACLPGVLPVRSEPYQTGPQPGYPRLGSALPPGDTRYSNRSIADVFVRLTHDFEWGGRRPHLVRYEMPVAVGMTGAGAARYTGFVDSYLSEIRGRTGIDISRTATDHNLVIHFVPGSAFRSLIPEHVCVVAPGRLTWEVFRQDKLRHGSRAFEAQRRIDAMTVLIPDNAEPYLTRNCLIEEIAQALGPANDLYGLGPTIFNDDAAHIWPTRLDYLMLRILYRPEMRTGMTRRQTRAAAMRVLAQINPEGVAAPPLPEIRQRSLKGWHKAIREVFDRSSGRSTRIDAAQQAVAIARARAPRSAYHCHSLTTLARVSGEQPKKALAAIAEAEQVCTAAHGAEDIRLIRLALDRARMHYALDDHRRALTVLEPLEVPLAAHAQSERLVAFYALQAASLRAIQQPTRSFEARRRAGEWGAYALGSDHPDVLTWLLQ